MSCSPLESESEEEDEPELKPTEIEGAESSALEEGGEEQGRAGLLGLGWFAGREEQGQNEQEVNTRAQAMSKEHPLLIQEHGEQREGGNSTD